MKIKVFFNIHLAEQNVNDSSSKEECLLGCGFCTCYVNKSVDLLPLKR